jgi:hypothetical protein
VHFGHTHDARFCTAQRNLAVGTLPGAAPARQRCARLAPRWRGMQFTRSGGGLQASLAVTTCALCDSRGMLARGFPAAPRAAAARAPRHSIADARVRAMPLLRRARADASSPETNYKMQSHAQQLAGRCRPAGGASAAAARVLLLLLLASRCAADTPPQVAAWVARVQQAGASVSAPVAAAHARFYDTLQAAGLLSKLVRLNTFSGDSLAAALVPLLPGSGYPVEQRSEASGYGGSSFAATYASAAGLTQISGYLVTGQFISKVNLTDYTSAASTGANLHLAVYLLGNFPNNRCMGVYRESIYTRHYLISANGDNGWGVANALAPNAAGAGLYMNSGALGGAPQVSFCNLAGVCSAANMNTDSSQPSDVPVGIFTAIGTDTGNSGPGAAMANGAVSGTKVAGYSIGYALSAADVRPGLRGGGRYSVRVYALDQLPGRGGAQDRSLLGGRPH